MEDFFSFTYLLQHFIITWEFLHDKNKAINMKANNSKIKCLSDLLTDLKAVHLIKTVK